MLIFARSKWIAAIAFWAGIANINACASDSVVEEAMAGNESALSAIRSLYAKVKLQVIPAGAAEPSLEYDAEYYRDLGFVRVHELCVRGLVGQAADYAMENGVQREVVKRPGPGPNQFHTRMNIAPASKRMLMTDCWKLALCGIPPFDSDNKQMRSFKETCQSMTVKSQSRVDNKEFQGIKVTLTDAADDFDIWLNSSANWMISKITRTHRASNPLYDTKLEYEAADFREIRPAIFFPTHVVMKSYLKGKLNVTQIAKFDAVRINLDKQSPIPKDLPTKHGMKVTDEIKGVTYESDIAGRPIGTTNVLRRSPPGYSNSVPTQSKTLPTKSGSVRLVEEPPPAIEPPPSNWLVVALSSLGGTAVCAGFAILFFKRRMAKMRA